MSAAGRNVGIFGAHGAKAGQSPYSAAAQSQVRARIPVQNQGCGAVRRKRCYERMAGLKRQANEP